MEDFECYLLELTGHYTPFHDGRASPVLRRVDNGAFEHSGLSDHPLYQRIKCGAMWMDHRHGLVVRTPAGDWHVDSKANGDWTRDGVLPHITVTPSIRFKFEADEEATHGAFDDVRHYHGVLQHGILKELP